MGLNEEGEQKSVGWSKKKKNLLQRQEKKLTFIIVLRRSVASRFFYWHVGLLSYWSCFPTFDHLLIMVSLEVNFFLHICLKTSNEAALESFSMSSSLSLALPNLYTDHSLYLDK